MICPKCNTDMWLDRYDGETAIFECKNPGCSEFGVEKRDEEQ